MINFCNFKGDIVACDDNTIQKYSLQPIYTCSDDEYEKAGCVYHIVDGQVVLGKDEKELAWDEIQEIKEKLAKYKEDVEQVELFGMERTDYEEKKQLCANMIVRLRELEKIVKSN